MSRPSGLGAPLDQGESRPNRRKDISNQRFGKLTAVCAVDKVNKKFRWLCLCDCGGTSLVIVSNLVNGHTQSCGCINMSADWNRRHGMTRTKPYVVWANMHQRCYDVNSTYYDNYGGRGISVCQEWRIFENFYADMGDPPEGLTIDRINNDGNYEKSNCRWATYKQQAANKRKRKPRSIK